MKWAVIVLSISLPFFSSMASEDNPAEDLKLVQAVSLAANKRWEDAAFYAHKSPEPEYAFTLVNALKMYYAPNAFRVEDIKQFFSEHPWLPISIYLPIIEKAINFESKPEEVINWFEFREPTTNYGKFLLLHANLLLENISLEDPEIKKALRYYWRSTEMDLNSEKYFINSYKSHLTVNDLLKKIEFLTWNKSFDQAERLIHILPSELKSLPLVRLKVAKNPSLVKRLLAKAPAKLKNDEFIKFTAIEQMLKKQEDQKALFALLRLDSISQHDKWWKLKHIAIRNALQNKSYRAAYQLTKDHKLTHPANSTEAEWLAGWIALRFLKEKESAKKHFEKMYHTAKLANTRSKAAYWLAQVSEQTNNHNKTTHWYKTAAEYVGTFYGHLSLARVSGSKKEDYSKNKGKIDAYALNNIAKLTKFIHLLYKTQNKKLAFEFINHFPYEDIGASELHFAVSYFTKKKLYPLAVELSKTAINKTSILVEEGYPQHLPIYDHNLPKGLYFAIIRQESKFDQEAISSAGAKGLMQIMPSTAYRLATMLGLPKNAYATNASANVKKGVLYVDKLYDQFKNCVLTIAAYNAGPGNVKKWIDKYGDPRTFRSYQEVLDWIELIPYAETRNYVKKVMENFVIYDSMLSPKHNARAIISFMLN